MWTIMWTENSQDRWDRLETKEEVMQLLDSLDKNSGVSKGDVWIFPPQADDLCLLYTSPSPRDLSTSRMPSSA